MQEIRRSNDPKRGWGAALISAYACPHSEVFHPFFFGLVCFLVLFFC